MRINRYITWPRCARHGALLVGFFAAHCCAALHNWVGSSASQNLATKPITQEQELTLWRVMSRTNKVVGYREAYEVEAREIGKAETEAFGADTTAASATKHALQWGVFGVMLVVALIVDYKYGGNDEEEDDLKTKGLTRKERRRKKRKRQARVFRKALLWTAAWVALAQLFSCGVMLWYGWERFLLFQASYLLEKALSLDNVFVFLMLFKSMHTPPRLQPDILNWGILLALVFRAAFIVAGTVLLSLFAWMMPLLGLFLIYTGYATWNEEDEDEDENVSGAGDGTDDPNARANAAFEKAAESSFFVRLLGKVVPLHTQYDPQGRLFVKRIKRAPRRGGGGNDLLPTTVAGAADGALEAEQSACWHATPQMIVLVAIAASDVVFAMDSIPAILSITTDPFLVVTSNCFAVMGLRSLFFVLAALQSMFKYLQQALAIILAAVGAKMVVGYWEVHVSIGAFLMFMFVILAAAMMASIAAVEREEEEAELLKRPQQLPAHFNPGLATHTVRSQPMLTPRGRKVPDWVSAQRLPSAQESTPSMDVGAKPTL